MDGLKNLKMKDILFKCFFKIFNKKKYHNYKNDIQFLKDKNFYDKSIRPKLLNIQNSIEKNSEINFLHSGHAGDIINSLPTIKEISKTKICNLFINLNKPIKTNYNNHPAGQYFINEKIYRMLAPLLETQKFLNSVNIYNNQRVDVNLDLFRELPISLSFDSMKFYFHLVGIRANLHEKFLDVIEHKNLKNKITIQRSLRYQNHLINYNFLNKYKDLYFIGLENEYYYLKKNLPNLNFYNCKDFLEMAQIIKSSKVFIGNSSLGFTISEGLKVPRLLEASPKVSTQQVHGDNGYDFYFQSHFEKYFAILNGR